MRWLNAITDSMDVSLSEFRAKSQTRLSDFTFTFHFHALEKEMATHLFLFIYLAALGLSCGIWDLVP